MLAFFVPGIIYFLLWSVSGEQNNSPDQYEVLSKSAYYQALEKLFRSAREFGNKYDLIGNSILRLCDKNDYKLEQGTQEKEITTQVGEPLKRGFHKATAETCCSCETEYRIHDLGPKYYPRYIQRANCGASSCTNRTINCQPKEFLFNVIRRRTESEREHIADSLLPESLKQDWISETITVVIACECKQ